MTEINEKTKIPIVRIMMFSYLVFFIKAARILFMISFIFIIESRKIKKYLEGQTIAYIYAYVHYITHTM